MLKQFLSRVIHFALPTTCIDCGAVLPVGEPLGVCADCWKDLPFWRYEMEPIPILPPKINTFQAPFLYEEPVRGWILKCKFSDKTELASVLAEFMLRYIPEGKNVLLLPVPLHRQRLRWRLFNQAALLTRVLSDQRGVPWSYNALKRVKRTQPQVTKTRRQRQLMSSGAFWADPEQVKGKKVVLIDDIWTTGATMRACAIALRQAGAVEVHARTVAYVAP